MTVQTISHLKRYTLAVVSVMLAAVIRVLLNPILGAQVPFPTFLMAILLTAWYGGVGPGLVSLILGGLFATYFIMYPQLSFAIEGVVAQVSLAMYFVIGFGVAMLGGIHRRTQDQLEFRIRERTAEQSKANEGLRVSEERFRFLISDVLDYAIFTLDATGHITTWNSGAQRNKGYRSEEIIGQHFSRFYPPEDTAAGIPEQALRAAEKNGRWESLGWRVRKDGSRFWARVVILALKDEMGRLRGFTKITRDMTDTKRADERFRQAVESAPNGMVLVDSAGHMTLVNAQTERLFGYTRDELLGQPVELLIPERFREQHPRDRARFMSAPQVRSMGMGRDLHARRKDGSEFSVEVGLNPINTVDGPAVLCAVVDITERKRIEAERQKFVALADSSQEFIGMCGNDFAPFYVNPAGQRMLGLTSLAEACRMPVTEYFFPEDQAFITGEFLPRVARDGYGEVEVRFRHFQTGEAIWMLYNVFVIRDASDRVVGWATVSRNIHDRKSAETALRDRERFLRIVTSSARVGLVVVNDQYEYLFANEAYAEIFNLDVERIVGRRVFQVLPAAWEQIQPRLNLALAGERVGYELSVPPRNSATEHRWFRVGYEPRVDDTGKSSVVVVVVDITERKRAEEELRESEERFRMLANSIPQLAWIAQADGSIFWYNQRWYDYTGTTLQQMEGWGWQSVHDPAVLPMVMERWKAAINAGKSLDMEFPLRRADGQFRTFLTRVEPFKDSEGRVVRWFGTNTDVDDMKRMQESLRAAQVRLTSALSAGSIGTWTWDLTSDLLVADEFTAHMFSLEPHEASKGLPAESYIQAIVDDDQPVVLGQLAHAIQNCGNYDVEYRVVQDGGEIRWLHAKGRVENEAGKAAWFYGAVMDVTDRKKAETELHQLNAELEERVRARTAELEAANKELEAFSYSVSHDLRAPLRGIDGFSRILLKKFAPQLPPEAQEYLNDVRANSQQMGRLVDDLLAFSRLGRKPVARQHLVTARLVRECLHELVGVGETKHVDIQVGDIPDCEADPALLKQVWLNLLGNAIKYSGKHERPTIQIGCSFDTSEPVYFVKDNGVGFDMRYVHKLFGVFQRLHKAEDYEGTGVGLAIVQRIINRHGGRIWAEAELNKGATFFFTIASTGLPALS